MTVSEVLNKLGRAPARAGVLAQTADGRWLFVTELQFTYNPADPTMTVPSNVLIDGVARVPSAQRHIAQQRLAREIVRRLFTNSLGEKGDRLVLGVGREHPVRLGGWSEAGAEAQIIEQLEIEDYVASRVDDSERAQQTKLRGIVTRIVESANRAADGDVMTDEEFEAFLNDARAALAPPADPGPQE